MWAMIIALALLAAGMGIWAILLSRQKRSLARALQESEEKRTEAEGRERIYDAMLPARLCGLFQDGKLEKLCIGAEKSVRAAVLSVNIHGFEAIVRQQDAAGIFRFVNQILSLAVPCILYQEGEIDKFVNAGFLAFFLNSPERALKAAVSVCEALSEAGIKEEYAIGLSYGDVKVGVAGHERRFGIMTVSDTTGLADFLQEMAPRYRARILITGSLKSQIPDFEKNYNGRYLGTVYLKAAGESEELYDVYDGDEAEDKNGKRKTRLLFEKGVDLFKEGKYYDARLHFIEVLKANRMDGAAKEYLHLCDQYSQAVSGGTMLEKNFSYLEIY